MRIVDKYLLQELGTPFALSLGVLTFVLLTREILRLVELLINKGVGFFLLLKTFLILWPAFFVLTLPMACLIASIGAFSRLSSDHELMALHANGISTGRLLRPLLVFTVAIFAMTIWLAQYSHPWTGQSVKQTALMMLRGQLSLAFDEGVFNTPIKNVVMYVGESDSTEGAHGVFISDTRNASEPRIIVGRDWAVINDPLHNRVGMTLQNGSIHVNPKDPDHYRIIRFSVYDFTMDISESMAGTIGERPSIFEIRYRLNETHGEDSQYRKLLEEEYKNLAYPFATFVFGFIGAPLGMVAKRSGKVGGFALSILIMLSYYVLNVIADFWVLSGVMAPFLGAWFPNLVFAAVTVVLFQRWRRPLS